MPRPIRFAEPVTSTTLPARSNGLLTVHLYFIGVDAFELRLGQTAGVVGPGPEDRGRGAERAGPGPDRAGTVILRGDAGAHHREHHGGPDHRFNCRKDPAPKLVR